MWVTELNNMKYCSDIYFLTFLTYILNFNNWLFIIVIIDGGIALEVSKLKIAFCVVLFFNSYLVLLASCWVPLALNDSYTCVCVHTCSHHCVGKTGIVYIYLTVGGG